MQVSHLVCLFSVYSTLGWIYETIFCTVKYKKWDNRGFLYGPVCPIYGVGAVLISIISDFLPGNASASRLEVFLVSFFGSMILEFVTSYVLELLFHAVWWDYSQLPLNIQGRTSVPTSIGFGLAGIVVVEYIAPRVESVVGRISPMQTECLSLVCVALFSADLTLTVSALTNFARIVSQMEDSFNERMESFVETTQKRTLHARRFIAMESMGDFRKLALRRVNDFRYPTISRERVRQLLMERAERRKNSKP